MEERKNYTINYKRYGKSLWRQQQMIAYLSEWAHRNGKPNEIKVIVEDLKEVEDLRLRVEELGSEVQFWKDEAKMTLSTKYVVGLVLITFAVCIFQVFLRGF